MIDDNIVLLELNQNNLDLVNSNWEDVVENDRLIVLVSKNRMNLCFNYCNQQAIRAFENWVVVYPEIFDLYLKKYKKDFSIISNILKKQ